ncbi:hypothetical protein ACFOPX_00795 [Helicobacter baculiformis]|uniref:Uncharacterized protein n=1 Tax=Helicobacter baculiformis TaxID=427351 RepID=A0ABV7ZFM4_9HELI
MGVTGGVSAVVDRESISAGVKSGVHTIKNALGGGYNQNSNSESASHNVGGGSAKGGENTARNVYLLVLYKDGKWIRKRCGLSQERQDL